MVLIIKFVPKDVKGGTSNLDGCDNLTARSADILLSVARFPWDALSWLPP